MTPETKEFYKDLIYRKVEDKIFKNLNNFSYTEHVFNVIMDENIEYIKSLHEESEMYRKQRDEYKKLYFKLKGELDGKGI